MSHAIGPGPGAYRLAGLTGYENHDVTRYRNPEYSFGLRPPLSFTKPYGPGPRYELCKMTRFGKATEPEYTMAPKLPIKRETGTPGPGAHCPEKVPPMKGKRPPEWSMGKRVGMRDTFKSPGPASYALPCETSYPYYTMAKRLPPPKIPGNSSPGPANYGLCSADVYKSKPPEYTMRPALKPKPLQSYNPGPAAYCPNLYVNKSTPPQYTFGTVCHKIPLITAEDNYPCEDYDVYVDDDQC
ncbi:outer dense fiber protein 3-like protein 2 [Chrysoperla carnea]|uniref:outer dense fiber protein 3-like protein 2 n=1 Tax=Chrysoperla carnea TaxID=189513 RepID=UPI001D06193C|nr:outer dense fiber protein 3-like protein 2 [Chrysoperla carnea]